jgi:predicted molibdopterin-dependent oxidoreductase YjgC
MAVTLTINGIMIKTEPGTTVLEAAQANNIYIPTLCHHPKLTSVGACRLCLVEIDNMRGFSPACTIPVSDGMVVRTETEDLQNMRREILSLILSEHPYTCLVCERRTGCDDFQGTIRKAAVTTGCQYCPSNGLCELPKLVDYLKLHEMPYPISYRGLPVEHDDPFFDRDYNLCVLCGRCVRVCQDVRQVGVLAFTYRGSQAIVGTAFGRSHLEVDCQFCGACVDVCPSGALADKRGKWEGAPTAVVRSVCPYCSVGCAVNIQVKNGHVIRAVGHDQGLTNGGQLCVRGRFGVVDVVHSLARLKTPLVRRNGRLTEVSWDEALNAAAQGLSQYKGDEFAMVASSMSTNEESYILQKFARVVMHSNNIALAGSFPEHKDRQEIVETLRTLNAPAIRDIHNMKCILAIGANVFDSHPVMGLEIRQALSNGARLITLDIRETEMAKRSDMWLQPKVGTDHILLAAMIKVLAEGRRTLRSAEFARLDLAKAEAMTGVKQDIIVTAARVLAQHTPAVIFYGSGVTHYPTALDVIKAVRSLAFVVGDVGIIGVPGEGNFVGAHDMGTDPALLPGYRPVSSSKARAIFETGWNTSLSTKPGLACEDILAAVRQDKIKALYLAGEVPPMKDLVNLAFFVVQDIVSTENLQHAHVVLPATTFAEMEGTLTNLEGRVQRVRQAIPAVGLSRPGWMIVRDVAKLMGAGQWNYNSAEDVMAEISSFVPAYQAMNYKTLDTDGVLRRFKPAASVKLAPFRLSVMPEFLSDEFPFTLITERNLFYYHGASLTQQVKGMNLVKREEVLQLNPLDLTRLGITDGAVVRIASRHGSTECIVQAKSGITKGTGFISVNRVTGSPLFPALTPTTKACAVRIAEQSRPREV